MNSLISSFHTVVIEQIKYKGHSILCLCYIFCYRWLKLQKMNYPTKFRYVFVKHTLLYHSILLSDSLYLIRLFSFYFFFTLMLLFRMYVIATICSLFLSFLSLYLCLSLSNQAHLYIENTRYLHAYVLSKRDKYIYIYSTRYTSMN